MAPRNQDGVRPQGDEPGRSECEPGMPVGVSCGNSPIPDAPGTSMNNAKPAPQEDTNDTEPIPSEPVGANPFVITLLVVYHKNKSQIC